MNTAKFEKLLREEKQQIEKTLSSVGTKNPNVPGDWEPTYPDLNVDPSDRNDMADEVEEFDNALGVENALEEKLREIDAALSRIGEGTFGKCAVDGEEIDEARLEANPAATTCIKHSSQ
ncbi:MAG: TraR/DksA C4-type zinc finger protein [Patescibacteria group bacterium]